MKIIKILSPALTALACLLVSAAALAQTIEPAKTLDQLLDRVVQNQGADAGVHQERIQSFETQRNRQAQLLEDARADVQEQESIAESLKQEIEANKEDLAALDTELHKALGNFEELFGVTRQVAGDTLAQLNTSLISAQFPGRDSQLIAIVSEDRVLPTVEQLRQLWLLLLQEQTEQANVVRFDAPVDIAGKPAEKSVLRIGPFSAMADGKFLVYKPEAERLAVLPRQPAAVYRRSADTLEEAAPGEIVAATVDPSGGAILSLLVEAPSLLERFHQGGIVGYLVSALAVVGLFIGLLRIVSLWLTSGKVHRQMKDSAGADDNPLGRVLRCYESSGKADVETLELKLEDAVLKEVPRLERGLGTLKVLAAIAPLMGLLGTVVGMILTFQSITLWGTTDPKLMAGGISQALITTVLGLIAAIPLLLLHNVASGRARLLQQILQEQSAGLVAKRAEVAHG